MEMTRENTQSSTSSLSVPRGSSIHSSQSAMIIGSSPVRPSPIRTSLPLYRIVRPLPYELRQHVTIYFEEGLYCQALDFLKALLVPGTTSSTKQPAIVPPPQQLALIATLTVHPTLTTRAKALDRIQAANLALQYLQLTLRHAGPAPGTFEEAFTFAGQGTSTRHGGNNRRRTTVEGLSPATDYSEGIGSEMANSGSLWARAESFWQVVGWSFNCSVLHKRRWERWSAWLTLMIEILELDWDSRIEELGTESRWKSLIVKYINPGGAVAGRERKILRAVFADGRAKSVAEFGEIWKNETKELKKGSEVKKAQARIDIEANNYGDYMEEEDDEDVEDSASDRSSPPPDTQLRLAGSIPNIASELGGMDSINLRIRLLSLLSKVSDAVPEAFTDLNTLYRIFFEHIRPLPMPAFFAIMSPAGLRYFDPTAASTLTQYILRSIIAGTAPLPPNDNISQDILEASYLPYPANTNSIVDNTKVSLCVETLLRLLDQYVGLEWTQELQNSAEAGIKSRNAKGQGKQTRKSTDRDGSYDFTWLKSSAERIRMVVEMTRP